MITINDNKIYSIYCRTNRRVQWRYAEYGGRYETIEKAIEKAKEHYKEKVEYIVEDNKGEVAANGFIHN